VLCYERTIRTCRVDIYAVSVKKSDSQSNWIRKPMTECAIIARPILPRSAGPPAPSSGSDNTLRDAPDRPGAKPLRTRCGRYSLSLINIHDLPLPTNGELAATTDRILRSSFGNNSAERRRLARGVYILGAYVAVRRVYFILRSMFGDLFVTVL